MKFKRGDRGDDALQDDVVNPSVGDQFASSASQSSEGSANGRDGVHESSSVATQVRVASPNTAAGNAGQQLGDVLVLRGLVTHDQVQEALELQKHSGGRLGELLVQMGVLEERDLVGAPPGQQ